MHAPKTQLIDQYPTLTSATAIAHPNIALVKYWGKRDERLMIPNNDSLSMTLDIYPTVTTVSPVRVAPADTVVLNGVPATGEALDRVRRFLELVRTLAGRREHAAVNTRNGVPTGAGLASSASGFAALAVAATAAYGLELDPTALSRLARRGSGSAARSIFAGFAHWRAGTGAGPEADASSYAEPVDAAGLDAALVVAVVDAEPKAVSSRAAMLRTVRTSPLYWAWVDAAADDIAEMRAAIARGELAAVGEIAERNAMGMHATMLAARPAVRYLSPASLRVFDEVLRQRARGVLAYLTVDAGPNVKVLCASADADAVAGALRGIDGARSVVVGHPGPAARLVVGNLP